MYNKEIESILELEGVNAKGFGTISQAVMFDRNISITAKAIYAYLASHLGAGRTIFPKRETILKDLKISKNAYYKHFNQLLENGYITVSKMKGYINRNVYKLCNNPKKVITKIKANKEAKSLLSIDGINANGYGIIPKLIMKDERLSIKAKGLIAFFYSLAQSDNTTFPHRDTICVFLNISKDVYYTALNQLIDTNYITVSQRHSKNGKFSVNDYILNSNPSLLPCLENCDIEETRIKPDNSPCPKNEDIDKNRINTEDTPCLKKCDNERVGKNETLPCQENCDNNNSTTVNNISNIIPSNLNLTYIPYTTDKDEIRQMIYELTYYEEYINHPEAIMYRKVVNALIEMLTVNSCAIYNKQGVKTITLFEYLNDCLLEDIYGYSLRDLILQIENSYQMIRGKYKIKHPYEYLKSFIWDSIKNFGI